MYINNVDDEKGFKDFDWVKANQPGIIFHEETKYLKKHLDIRINEQASGFILSGSSHAINTVTENIYKNSSDKAQYDFENEEKKVWISVNLTFFHFFLDTIGSILILNNTYPKIHFIIDFVDAKNNNHDVYLDFLMDFLIQNDINYTIIEDSFVLKINNFYEVISLNQSDFVINEIYKSSRNYVDSNIKPTKKVYISRKFTPCHRNPDEFEARGIDIKKVGYSDIRVYNETYLENFFRDRGFEIVYAEKFSSIKEQINFFNEVKVLVAATSSGLINAIFMQPEGTVIELMTPFIPGVREVYELHSSQYLEISYAKKHSYLGIPSKFYGKKIVSHLCNNKNLFSFIIKDGFLCKHDYENKE